MAFYTPTNSGVRRLPAYGGGYSGAGAVPPAGEINASNLAYVRGGIATDPTAGATADFLNPNWSPAVYDVEKRGAELAVGGGYGGSPLAAYQTGRMRAADIERRAALANSLLSGAASRVPNPANQENLLALQQNQNQFNERNRLDQERQRLEQEKFDWEKQQQNLRTQQNAGYRYQSGRGSYSPLPQYMNSRGPRDGYSINRWIGDHPGGIWEDLY